MSNLVSTSRKSFLTEYVSWASTGHAPELFHKWAGISAIAACLERKVWLSFDRGRWTYFPPLFVFCVAHPAVGKSSAIDRARNVLLDLNRTGRANLVRIPNSLSESALIECMAEATQASCEGTQVRFEQSAAYFFSGEGSQSLKAIHSGGGLVECLTSLYDCDELWERKTRAHGNEVIRKGCFNMLMGTTFSFLGKLLAGDAIMGGFASRVTYVIYEDKFIRPSDGLRNGAPPEGAVEAYVPAPKYILDGFARIHQMRGPFTCTDEFILAYEEWSPKAQLERQQLVSEKMQALLGRKEALLIKLSMILSAAESSDRVLRIEHWNEAMALANECEAKLPGLIRSIQIDPTSQAHLIQSIFASFNVRGECGQEELKRDLIVKGFDPYRIDSTVVNLIQNHAIGVLPGGTLRLLIDPNAHL